MPMDDSRPLTVDEFGGVLMADADASDFAASVVATSDPVRR
jgi:hypothetical protein